MANKPVWKIPEVKAWEMENGQVTKIRADDGYFLVNPDSDIDDPVAYIEKFFKCFKIINSPVAGSKMVNATGISANKGKTKPTTERKKQPRHKNEDIISVQNNVGIYKSVIPKIFEEMTGQFKRNDLVQFFWNLDKRENPRNPISEATAKNRASAYTVYLTQNKKMKEVGKDGQASIYEMIRVKAPEYDPEEARLRGIEERKAMQGTAGR